MSDTLPDTPAVLTGGADIGSDALYGSPSSADALSDVVTGGSDSVGAQVPAVLTLSDRVSDTPAVLSGGADTGLDILDGDRSSAVALPDTPAS